MILTAFNRITDDLTCRLEVCGLREEDCVPGKGGKDRGGGSRGVENGVEEELPVGENTNSLINLSMDAPADLQWCFFSLWTTLFDDCSFKKDSYQKHKCLTEKGLLWLQITIFIIEKDTECFLFEIKSEIETIFLTKQGNKQAYLILILLLIFFQTLCLEFGFNSIQF